MNDHSIQVRSIKQTFNELLATEKDWAESCSLFLCRPDGILLFSHRGAKSAQAKLRDADDHSVGALICGVWQASSALTGTFGSKADIMQFRLSFDTSDCGVYILPLILFSREYYMGLLYSQELNPGALKNKVRLLAHKALGKLSGPENKTAPTLTTASKEKVLFSDIRDDEIDRMFANIL